MKVLVFNGSPKGERSNSMKLTEAFLRGFVSVTGAETEIVDVGKLNLRPCMGCFACWNKTPGKCVIGDDMGSVIEKILRADVVVYSFPLYYFGLPGPLKTLLDRQLPMALPFMESDTVSGGHASRYDTANKRYVMISTCGFHTAAGNYDAVNEQMDRVFGKGRYETLYCGQGELFGVKELRARTDEYLEHVRKAGEEYASGGITEATEERLREPLFPREAFEKMADASWGVSREDGGKKTDPAVSFTKQMAALYNPSSWDGRDRVLEFFYTDVRKTVQIAMKRDGAEVLEENLLPCTTRIETPLSVWREIGSGELDGRQAMMEHRYRVTGDFDLLLRWDDFFGVRSSREKTGDAKGKKTNMTLMLLPWIVIWISLSLDGVRGGMAGIVLCAVLPLAFLRWRPTVFEYLSLCAVTLICLPAVLGVRILYLLPLSYLLFGVMWTVSVFLKVPLSAYYSMNDYGMEEALKNPLFMRTNRILTACWGALYLITPIWTWFLLQTPQSSLTGAINSVLPVLAGIFTAWFQKWYPAHYARKAE